MSLGENLQFLRKRENITQEQLAEKLEVSRQSVSKWESDTTYPEMDKLLQISGIFHCTLDDIVQKDISSQYVEDKAHYDDFQNKNSIRITIGVNLILFGLTLMVFLTTIFSEIKSIEKLTSMIFFIFTAVSVALFIISGLQSNHFAKKNPYIENFYSEEEKDKFYHKFTILITTGVILIFIGLICFMGLETALPSSLGKRATIGTDELLSALFLFFVTISVTLFVYAGIQKNKYNIKRYNLLHDPNSMTYKNDKKTGLICGCLMMIATIIFLICGLLGNLWWSAAVIYSVFGIACGIASIIINRNNEEENEP